MRVTPRKPEIERVAEVLTAEGFGTPADMAKEVIKVTAKEILGHRDTWIVFNRPAVIGPYGSESEATKAAEKMPALSDQGIKVIRMFPVMTSEAYFEPDFWTGCKTCQHQKGEHLADGNSKGKCGYHDCPCSKWVTP